MTAKGIATVALVVFLAAPLAIMITVSSYDGKGGSGLLPVVPFALVLGWVLVLLSFTEGGSKARSIFVAALGLFLSIAIFLLHTWARAWS